MRRDPGARRDPAVIGYAGTDVTPPESWIVSRRGGVASVACTAAAVLVLIGGGVVAGYFGDASQVVAGLAAAAAVVLLPVCGLIAGLVGADHDRHRGLGIVGAFLNLALLLGGCLRLRLR